MALTPITQLLPPIAEVVRQCPASTLIRAYVAAVREFCNETRWLRTTVLGQTAIGIDQYNLGDDPNHEIFGIRAMSIRNSQSRWDPVTERAPTLWDQNSTPEQPAFYAYLPHGQFVLSSTPSAVRDLKLTVVVQPKPGCVAIDASLLVDWTEVFRAGALWNLLRIKDQPWSDPKESSMQYQLFTAGKARGLSAVSAGYNAGSAATDRDGGPNGRVRGTILAI